LILMRKVLSHRMRWSFNYNNYNNYKRGSVFQIRKPLVFAVMLLFKVADKFE